MKRFFPELLLMLIAAAPAAQAETLDFSIGNWQQHRQIIPADENQYRGFVIEKPKLGNWTIAGPKQREQRAVWQILDASGDDCTAVGLVDVSKVLSEEAAEEYPLERLQTLVDRKMRQNSMQLVELKYESAPAKHRGAEVVKFRLTGIDNPKGKPPLKVVIIGCCGITKERRLITVQAGGRAAEPNQPDEAALQSFLDAVKF